MLNDIDVQTYRDFAENLGNYNAGATNVPVYKKRDHFLTIFVFLFPILAESLRQVMRRSSRLPMC